MSSSLLPNGAPIATTTTTTTPPGLSRLFLHPTISRLRSYTPHASPGSSATSAHSALRGVSPAPSSFTLSPGSSSSALVALPYLPGTGNHDVPFPHTNGHDPAGAREVFRWTHLRALEPHLFARPSNKAQAVLGAAVPAGPTVMSANGLICIGTESGRVLVFDFKQTLRCICGDPAAGELQDFSKSPFSLHTGWQKRRSAR
jgi:hypothetical protein